MISDVGYKYQDAVDKNFKDTDWMCEEKFLCGKNFDGGVGEKFYRSRIKNLSCV